MDNAVVNETDMTTGGGQETYGLLERTEEKSKLCIEGGKNMHFAKPKPPAVTRVGDVKTAPTNFLC